MSLDDRLEALTQSWDTQPSNLSGTAANSITLPKAKPRTVRERVVVSPIRSRKVASAQRSGVRYGKEAL
jgi:hypothetical protein